MSVLFFAKNQKSINSIDILKVFISIKIKP